MGKINFQKSIHLTKDSFILIFAAYALDVIYARFTTFAWGLWVAPLFLVLKIYLFGGIFATCIDMVFEENYRITLAKTLKNCQKYAWSYLLLLASIVLVYIFFTSLFEAFKQLTFLQAKNHFQFFVYPLIAYLIIISKHGRVGKKGYTKRRLSYFVLVAFIGAYCIDIFLFYFSEIIDVVNFEIPRITLFLSRSLQTFMFFYVAILIADPYISEEKEATGKELYLIRPVSKGLPGYFSRFVVRKYPSFFHVLRALTPADYKVKEFDQKVFSERDYKPGKLVAITSYTSNAFQAYHIARKFKKSGSTVVMGGPHVNFLPEEALEYCDSVVVGEAEGVWPKLIEDYEKGELQKVYFGEPLEKFYEKTDDFILKDLDKNKDIFLEVTRGCKYGCDFCTIPSLSFGRIRRRPIENIAQMIQKTKKKKMFFYFLDNNIFADPEYARKLFMELQKHRIRWVGSSSLDIAKNDEDLDLLKKSGCVELLIGYEIFSLSSEKEKRGKYSLADEYLSLTKKIKKRGIAIKAQFILGFESDTIKSYWHLWKFAFKLHPTESAVSVLTPLPGSQLFQKMTQEDRFINLNWSNYALDRVVFKHPFLNEKVLSVGYYAYYLFFHLTTSLTGHLFLLCLILADYLF
ncbi:MAG: radical SAM protein [Candidatus Omnitrophica bacterium]|nr:radical SAM protein [Candidatus Omnitrophota bacterium]